MTRVSELRRTDYPNFKLFIYTSSLTRISFSTLRLFECFVKTHRVLLY